MVGGNGHLPRGRGGDPLQERGQSRDCGRIESWQYKKANILTESQAKRRFFSLKNLKLFL